MLLLDLADDCAFGLTCTNMSLIRKLILFLLAFAAGTASAAGCGEVGKIPDEIHAARVLLFGEVHGTAESPFVVGQILCRLFEHQEAAIALALELPLEMNPALAIYLKSEGAGKDIERLLDHPFWERGLQDGRSSLAVFGLIERARILMAQGKRLTVHAVGGGSQGLANEIRAVTAHHPGSKLVALTGNAHALKVAGTAGALAFDPMGYLIRDLAPYSVSLEFDSGTAWVCIGSDCGPRHMGGRFGRSDGVYGFHGGSSVRNGYDASFQLGAVTASPPARNVLRK